MGDSLNVYRGRKEVEVRIRIASGVINSSLWQTIVDNNIDYNLPMELSEIYAWAIDFYRIQKGDQFKVFYEEKYVDDKKIGMGKVTFQSKAIPMDGPDRQVIREALDIDGTSYEITCLSIGNPHCVIPLGDISEALTRRLGPLVECHPLFPNRTNVQFVRVIDRHTLEIQIWERGAGYTLASGSSACAAVAATHKLALVDSPVTVRMPGGALRIDLEEGGHIFLTGPVEYVFEGEIASLP